MEYVSPGGKRYSIRVHRDLESVERLMVAYVPVFDEHSKEPMPEGYARSRAAQLWKGADGVRSYFVQDEEGNIVGGSLNVELTRERPPEFIPDEIFQRVLAIAGPSRRIIYNTALFRKRGFDGIKALIAFTRQDEACYFYATIDAIHRTISPPHAQYIGMEPWLGEERKYFCFNIGHDNSTMQDPHQQ